MIQSNAVLVRDRPAVRQDDLAGRTFQNLPAAQRFLRIRCAAIEVGNVDAGPIIVNVREMGENKHAFPNIRKAFTNDFLGFYRCCQNL